MEHEAYKHSLTQPHLVTTGLTLNYAPFVYP